LAPQQATVPSVFTPQVYWSPALTNAKVPSGGVAAPKAFSPQQATVPSVFTAQAWNMPTLTEVKVPAGTGPWP
jgi:uncharacterized protein (DUF2336 family)